MGRDGGAHEGGRGGVMGNRGREAHHRQQAVRAGGRGAQVGVLQQRGQRDGQRRAAALQLRDDRRVRRCDAAAREPPQRLFGRSRSDGCEKRGLWGDLLVYSDGSASTPRRRVLLPFLGFRISLNPKP